MCPTTGTAHLNANVEKASSENIAKYVILIHELGDINVNQWIKVRYASTQSLHNWQKLGVKLLDLYQDN